MNEESSSPVARFNVWQTLRLSSFQIGSAMGDIITTSVWNRIMISELGIPAWPVGLLIALRYLLSPISLWAGHRSDTQTLWGWHRTSYIWLGRGLMVLSFPMLGVSLGRLGADQGDVVGWLVALFCFLLYGLGTLISGSPFLALVRDTAPKSKQGLAISIVETVLIIMFPVVAIGFGRWMQTYDERVFWEMILVTMGVAGFFWFFAVVRQEKRARAGGAPRPGADEPVIPVRAVFNRIWKDPRTRLFFVFLSLATFSAWMQDNVLEPFGGDVFKLDVGETTRFTGYWGAFTVITLLGSFFIWRKRPPETLSGIARIGLTVMSVGMLFLAVSGLVAQERLIMLGLVVFGAGFGLYTFGGLSLMAVMSPDPDAGAYLGLWTISILIFKGLGTFIGGALRDILLLGLGMSEAWAYAGVFFVSMAGLFVAAVLLRSLDVLSFARDTGRVATSGELQLSTVDL